MATEEKDETRDEKGRFLPGNTLSPGREKGVPNRFTQLRADMLTAYETAAEGELAGICFWRHLKRTRPGLFARILAGQLPRQILASVEREPIVVKYVLAKMERSGSGD